MATLPTIASGLQINIGADPEYFIIDKNGKPIPAHRVFGTQAEEKARYSGSAINIFRDGFAVELNTAPATCREYAAQYIHNAFSSAVSRINPWLAKAAPTTNCNHCLQARPAVRINLDEDMKDAPPDVLEVGCSPVLNAYDPTLTPRKSPINFRSHEWRYAGGHMHFTTPVSQSWHRLNRTPLMDSINYARLVKLLDLYVGVPASIIFDSELTFQRRQWFGQAGEFRISQFPGFAGIEYRVLGPEWTTRVPFISFFFGIARDVIVGYEILQSNLTEDLSKRVQSAINGGKGLFDVLQDMPGWYTRDIVTFMRDTFRRKDILHPQPSGAAGYRTFMAAVGREGEIPPAAWKLV